MPGPCYAEVMAERGATRVLYALKATGPQTADAIARRLGFTPTAARQHLDRLLSEALVQFADRRRGIGRPARLWSLTAKGHGRFPDNHAGLSLELLRAAGKAFGAHGLARLIAEREKAMERLYQARLAGAAGLAGRLRRLAVQRSEEGYMAAVERKTDGSFLLKENHCPICVAAKACQGLCRSELDLFQRLLAPEAEVERVEHIIAGARRCAYRITPKEKPRGAARG
jgi:predicted ArsR family transcriptional regulator